MEKIIASVQHQQQAPMLPRRMFTFSKHELVYFESARSCILLFIIRFFFILFIFVARHFRHTIIYNAQECLHAVSLHCNISQHRKPVLCCEPMPMIVLFFFHLMFKRRTASAASDYNSIWLRIWRDSDRQQHSRYSRRTTNQIWLQNVKRKVYSVVKMQTRANGAGQQQNVLFFLWSCVFTACYGPKLQFILAWLLGARE